MARLLSNTVSPPVIFAVMGLLLSLAVLPLGPALIWAATFGFFVSLLPILFVFWLLHTGRIAELHMSNTAERHLPYLVAVVSSALLYLIIRALNGPPILACLAVSNIITLAALGVINARWLISFHATAASAAWMITLLVFGWPALLLAGAVVALVIVIRLYLQRHTVAQVIAGIVLGITVIAMMSQFGCFS